MLRIGVIGVGFMGRNHARIYSDLDQVELVAVSDPFAESSQKVAQKRNCKAYTNHQEMLANEQLDAVSIAAPTSLHKNIAIDAIKAGCHVLIEKPIATTPQEAQEIIACAKEHNKLLMVGHIERFNPAVQELKNRVHELGEVYKIDVQRIGAFPPRISDVGVIIDLSVHDIDVINNVLQAEPSRIYAETQQKLHPNHEDSVTALVRYTNDTLATFNINYLSPNKVRQLRVFGKKGMFRVDYLNQDLYFYENDSFTSEDWNSMSEGDMRKISLKKREPLLCEIESFVDAIVNNKPSPVSGEHGVKVLETALLFKKSATENKIIHL